MICCNTFKQEQFEIKENLFAKPKSLPLAECAAQMSIIVSHPQKERLMSVVAN